MRIHCLIAGVALLLAGCFPAGQTSGRVQIDDSMPCMPLDAWSPDLDPPIAYGSVVSCTKQGDFSRAADLAILSASYVQFDRARVHDRTAHRVADELLKQAYAKMTVREQSRLRDALDRVLSDPSARNRVCKTTTGLGAPRYAPDYMAYFGIESFSKVAQVTLGEEDAEGLWRQEMKQQPICQA